MSTSYRPLPAVPDRDDDDDLHTELVTVPHRSRGGRRRRSVHTGSLPGRVLRTIALVIFALISPDTDSPATPAAATGEPAVDAPATIGGGTITARPSSTPTRTPA